jgi:hypothetical protein
VSQIMTGVRALVADTSHGIGGHRHPVLVGDNSNKGGRVNFVSLVATVPPLQVLSP